MQQVWRWCNGVVSANRYLNNMSLNVKATLSLNAEDISGKAVLRLTRGAEKTPKGAKRAITRYAQLIERAAPSPANIIRDMAEAIGTSRIDLLGRMEYPPVEVVTEAIRNAPIDVEIRSKLIRYIGELDYSAFAKLLEAVENYHRVSG